MRLPRTTNPAVPDCALKGQTCSSPSAASASRSAAGPRKSATVQIPRGEEPRSSGSGVSRRCLIESISIPFDMIGRNTSPDLSKKTAASTPPWAIEVSRKMSSSFFLSRMALKSALIEKSVFNSRMRRLRRRDTSGDAASAPAPKGESGFSIHAGGRSARAPKISVMIRGSLASPGASAAGDASPAFVDGSGAASASSTAPS